MHMGKDDHTPLMQQYFPLKNEHPDALLLFQVGDFYELFFDDAKRAAASLGIALTTRGKNKGEPIPLCGVPVHALDHYLIRLVKAGFKVALCNQLEEAVPGKVVRRGITQVLTPGTLIDGRLLDEKSASYLLSFFAHEGKCGVLFAELLTAQLFATELDITADRLLETELARFFPDEIILAQTKEALQFQSFFRKHGYFTTVMPVVEHHEQERMAVEQLFFGNGADQIRRNFCAHESLRLALFYFHTYMAKNQLQALEQAWQISLYAPDDFLQLDAATQKNLELVLNVNGGKTHTVLKVLDRAVTPMGSRLIKKWLLKPLVKKEAIEQRLDAVELLKNSVGIVQELAQHLKQIGDIERVVGRIALRRAHIHDYLALGAALAMTDSLQHSIANLQHPGPLLTIINQYMGNFEPLAALLRAACNTDSTKDFIIAPGFDQELDQLRDLIENGNQKLLAFEAAEQTRTGISSLKVGFNSVHGYFIEITKANMHLVPADYVRYQTLVGKERYVNPTLQKLHYEITNARLEIKRTEEKIFERIKQEVLRYIHPLRKLSHALAHLDALLSFAHLAYHDNYVRPFFNEERVCIIEQGRHPVIEQLCQGSFIPNDTIMNDQASFFIVTGPNMGGKSTYLRQVALINLLAQCGSFVPARRAQLVLLDRIFTRIGAGDNLAQGKSTFLVEMEETAAICTQATQKSLVILDEVGRGTSTIDGLAIAQAVVEYLYEQVKARCLFATHYHELTELSQRYSAIHNYHAASKTTATGILFLYTIAPGVADGSFGVQVARAAQLPARVIARAQELVTQFTHEQGRRVTDENQPVTTINQEKMPEHGHLYEVAQRLSALDCDQISPRQALDILSELKRQCL